MKIRAARLDDAPRIGALAQRLREGPLPAWRDPAPLSASLDQAEAAFFGPDSDERVLLVCVDEADRPIGFAQAMMDRDFFSQETQGHLLFLVTDQAHERRGVARLLVTGVLSRACAGAAVISIRIAIRSRFIPSPPGVAFADMRPPCR